MSEGYIRDAIAWNFGREAVYLPTENHYTTRHSRSIGAMLSYARYHEYNMA
jgi:hypothetical protein